VCEGLGRANTDGVGTLSRRGAEEVPSSQLSPARAGLPHGRHATPPRSSKSPSCIQLPNSHRQPTNHGHRTSSLQLRETNETASVSILFEKLLQRRARNADAPDVMGTAWNTAGRQVDERTPRKRPIFYASSSNFDCKLAAARQTQGSARISG